MVTAWLYHHKNSTIQKLLAAPKELGIFFMVPLVFSGLFGGSTITGTVSQSYTSGMASAWYLIGTSIGCLLFLALVYKFYRANSVVKKSVSIPDAFAQRFDNRTKLLMVLVIVVTNSLALSTIPLSTATIISNITDTNYDITVWIICIVLIAMALLSGLKGVAAMNIIHTCIMFLGLILLSIPCFQAVGGVSGLKEALPATYFNITSTGLPSILAVLIGAVLAIMTSPLAVMTVVSSNSQKNAKKSLSICAILIIPFAVLLVFIGMCCRVINPGDTANAVLYNTAQSFGSLYYVFISMSVLAATFSTAPASLLSIITTLNNDIFYAHIMKNATEKQQKLFVNLGVVLLTVVLTLIGKNASSILGQLTGATQIKSVAGVVLICALSWPRIDRNAAFYTILAGSIVAMGWHSAGNPMGIQPLWPALVVTIVVLLATTLTNKDKISEDYIRYQKIIAQYDSLPEENK